MSEEKTTLSEKELKKVFYFWFSAFVRLSFSYVVPFRFEILVLSRTFLPTPSSLGAAFMELWKFTQAALIRCSAKPVPPSE